MISIFFINVEKFSIKHKISLYKKLIMEEELCKEAYLTEAHFDLFFYKKASNIKYNETLGNLSFP